MNFNFLTVPDEFTLPKPASVGTCSGEMRLLVAISSGLTVHLVLQLVLVLKK